MKIPVLAIPYYNRLDLLLRCVASIDCEVGALVITDNSPMGLTDGERELLVEAQGATGSTVGLFTVIRHPNAGVAGSWNEAIKLFPARWWLLVNNDIEFAPGDLEKMATAADGGWPKTVVTVGRPELRSATVEAEAPGCYYGNHGASWWAVTSAGIERVGLFDENFYPAYLEDCDWSRRADLLGCRRVNVPGTAARHGDERISGSCTVNDSPALQRESTRTHQGNFAYYERKWGGKNEREVYATPFNDPHWPLWAWRFETGMRAQQQWT